MYGSLAAWWHKSDVYALHGSKDRDEQEVSVIMSLKWLVVLFEYMYTIEEIWKSDWPITSKSDPFPPFTRKVWEPNHVCIHWGPEATLGLGWGSESNDTPQRPWGAWFRNQLVLGKGVWSKSIGTGLLGGGSVSRTTWLPCLHLCHLLMTFASSLSTCAGHRLPPHHLVCAVL